MSWSTVSERIKYHLNDMAALWVWGLSVVLAAMLSIVFNELHALGAFDAGDVERVSIALYILAGVGLVGFTLHLLQALTSIIAYFKERETA